MPPPAPPSDPIAGIEPDDPGGEPEPGDKFVYFSVPVTSDDQVPWDQLGERKLARLRRIATDPEFVRRVLPARVDAPATGIDPSVCGVLYDALSVLMVGIAQARGVPIERAAVLRFTPDEKGALVEPTAKVLSKYVGEFKYQDEIMLGVLVLTIINGKLQYMNQLAKGPHQAPPPPPPAPVIPLAPAPPAGPPPAA